MPKTVGAQIPLFDWLPRYEKVHVSKSTFKAGLTSRVHRWFRLTPSFGPDLVRLMLKEMRAQRHETVLDPFAGASTTLIEGRYAGFAAYGYEINPFLHFVGSTSLNWTLDPNELRMSLALIQSRFDELEAAHGNSAPHEIPFKLPAIHNIHRWWRHDVLVRLVILLDCIEKCCISRPVADFFKLCFAGVLVPDLTNVTLGRLQLHFIDRSEDAIDVWGVFAQHADTMIEDMAVLQAHDSGPLPILLHGDSVEFEPALPVPKVNLVITSPPYPNRYSYVWNTRPHLYMLGYFKGKREAGELDTRTVGGTWGTATSNLLRGTLEPINDAVGATAGPVVAEIRKHDTLMANYCMQYFNKLGEHFVNLIPRLAVGARVAYVVGCSRLRGVYVETDVLLSQLIAKLAPEFHDHDVHRFRKRNSGKDLHESAVYATFG